MAHCECTKGINYHSQIIDVTICINNGSVYCLLIERSFIVLSEVRIGGQCATK